MRTILFNLLRVKNPFVSMAVRIYCLNHKEELKKSAAPKNKYFIRKYINISNSQTSIQVSAHWPVFTLLQFQGITLHNVLFNDKCLVIVKTNRSSNMSRQIC